MTYLEGDAVAMASGSTGVVLGNDIYVFKTRAWPESSGMDTEVFGEHVMNEPIFYHSSDSADVHAFSVLLGRGEREAPKRTSGTTYGVMIPRKQNPSEAVFFRVFVADDNKEVAWLRAGTDPSAFQRSPELYQWIQSIENQKRQKP